MENITFTLYKGKEYFAGLKKDGTIVLRSNDSQVLNNGFHIKETGSDRIFIKYVQRNEVEEIYNRIKMKRTGREYDNIGDILEYGNITDSEAIAICNDIIDESISESEDQILEAMYHAIFTGVVNRKIADQLHTDIIIKSLSKFSEDVLDYVITILAFTGNRKYEGIIRQIGQRYGKLCQYWIDI